MKVKEVGSRSWLNPNKNSDTGAVQWYVEYNDYGPQCQFSIWDCSRKISLDFSFYNEKGANQRAKKIDILVKHLLLMKKEMGDAYADMVSKKRGNSSVGKIENQMMEEDQDGM